MHEIFKDIGSSLRPKEGMGTAKSQSLEFLDDTANKHAFSLMSVQIVRDYEIWIKLSPYPNWIDKFLVLAWSFQRIVTKLRMLNSNIHLCHMCMLN